MVKLLRSLKTDDGIRSYSGIIDSTIRSETTSKNLSLRNRIGARSKSVVCRGKLFDGREVAIKRGGAWSKIKTPFNSAQAILSRLPHHKNLVGVVGLCKMIKLGCVGKHTEHG
ncbi:hypothetical protein Fmac_014620 [Flemingia macrophylla]|uniref:Uncharacterized protein n=1 Tax=Flemingia macrophylla TaxID=520843 RepID=A0ABD1MCS8_9FABA